MRKSTVQMTMRAEAGWEVPVDANPVKSGAGDRVEDILQTLPKRDRDVLTCRFLLNLSIRQTALSMGVTEANVKVMQYRALRRAATLVESAAPPKRSSAAPHSRCPRPTPG
jgi:DNA-directed RNA polymerase specialized sigma24 family protein